jgi:hypothetical protein
MVDGTPVRTTSSRGNNVPVATRVEGDPSQATAWRKQSSVRHVQAPGGAPQQGQGTGQASPQPGMDFVPLQPGEYRDRNVSGGSHQAIGGPGQPEQQQLQQTPYRPRPASGQMGIAN